MPLISYEEACRKLGLSEAECDARAVRDTAQRTEAQQLCGLAIREDVHARNDCVQYCSITDRSAYSCALEHAQAQDVRLDRYLSTFNVATIAVGLLLGGYLAIRRIRRK